ncbi:MAG: NADH-quinone oxidoreductase subunit L, partial [Thermoanaerobaculia bacterium]|nr:NADH-quinone oxidoreductase subunit L [Thermoanaerobaculia bacterium]
ATMVTAGVYIVARSNALFQLAPDISFFVACVGTFTAIFAATIGLAQNDIKKVLAYSTVSQLGYMFLAAGMGAYSAAIFHVGTHAFFKALLFLGSGSVIHAMGGEQDMTKMGGLKKHMPVTYWTFLIATLAISGIPPLAGFFSKDEILHSAAANHQWILWAVGLLTAGLTACYMFRAVHLTFHGKFRGTHEQEHHLHESPPSMTVPLSILAVGSALVGFLGVPEIFGVKNWLHHWLEPIYAKVGHAAHGEMSHALEFGLIGLSVAVALAGIGLATKLFGGDRGIDGDRKLAKTLGGYYRLLADKYRIDELYDRLFVSPLRALSNTLWKFVDQKVIDGGVHLGAYAAEFTGELGRLTTTGNLRNYALYFVLGLVALFSWVLL